MFKEHGPVFVAYYVTTWTAGAAVCYGGITIAGIDGIALLKYLTVDEMLLQHTRIDISGWSPALINGLIALELNELLEYVRLPVVIATTPTLSRMLAPYRRGAATKTQAAAAVAEAATVALAVVRAAARASWRRGWLDHRRRSVDHPLPSHTMKGYTKRTRRHPYKHACDANSGGVMHQHSFFFVPTIPLASLWTSWT